MPESSTSIVFVHGALTDASIWHRVISELHRRDYHVLAPAMPLRGLTSDAAYLRSFLTTVEGPIIVVGHSYGGSIISHPDALTPEVHSLVFVAAFQQNSGETASELNGRFPGSMFTSDTTILREYPGGNDIYLAPDHFAEVYGADLDPVTISVMTAAQHPIDAAALNETFTDPATWTSLPSWTLIATADHSLPPEAQRFMAQRAGSTITQVQSSHAVPVAHPLETADLVAAAATSAAAAEV
jgi:pimeloyl-ACP methyl ester carboxylesterase